MQSQEYLETLINECKVYANSAEKSKEEYSKLFPDAESHADISKIVMEMNDESLLNYFKSSQGLADVQTIFSKIASFIYFCKHIGVELDVSKTSEVENLNQFISVYKPFETEFVIVENNLKEKDQKRFKEKFAAFKNSIGLAINMTKRNE